MSQAADDGEEDNVLEGDLSNYKDKMLSTATKVIHRPQRATVDNVNGLLLERQKLRKIYTAIQSITQSNSTAEDLQQEIRLGLEELSGGGGAGNAGNGMWSNRYSHQIDHNAHSRAGEPMDIDKDDESLS